MNVKQVPKIELHLHLDSSVSFEVIRQIQPAMSKKEFQEAFVAPPKCNNLPDYLSRVANQVELLQSKVSLKLATEGLIRQLEEDNIIYTEIRFAPLLHTKNGLQPQEIVEVVNETLETSSSDMIINIILCNLRDFSEAQSLQTAELVKQFSQSRVVGLDLAGDENGFPLDNHIKAYRFAREHDLPRTAHAGEACGPQSVRETLKQLRPTRIGHGVRSFEDLALIDLLKEENIHLEVCPTSNIQTNVYDTYADHTIDRLYEEGVSLSINTDGRTTSNVSLTEEYQKLQRAFGWGKKHFLQCNLNALDAAFTSESTKEKLSKVISKGFR